MSIDIEKFLAKIAEFEQSDDAKQFVETLTELENKLGIKEVVAVAENPPKP